jgi:hypothetical protein
MAVAAYTGAMVGRATEREVLNRLLAAAAGGAGATVLVEGEAGIGKTRLVQSLVEAARTRGVRTIVGAARPLGDPTVRRRIGGASTLAWVVRRSASGDRAAAGRRGRPARRAGEAGHALPRSGRDHRSR